MREFKVEGYGKVRLPEWAYKRLLKRFDVRNAESELGERVFVIKVPCICDPYEHCSGCPFEARAGGFYGCIDVLYAAGLRPTRSLVLCFSEVRWGISEDADARKELQAIHAALLKLPRS